MIDVKLSEVTIDTVKEYLRIDTDEEDELLNLIMLSANSLIKNRLLLNEEENLDDYEELSIALLILCSEMYDNRQYSIDKTNIVINPAVEMIFKNCLRHTL